MLRNIFPVNIEVYLICYRIESFSQEETHQGSRSLLNDGGFYGGKGLLGVGCHSAVEFKTSLILATRPAEELQLTLPSPLHR